MNVLHIGHVPLPKEIDLGNHVSPYAYYPGRWVLNLAIAQKAHSGLMPEILVKVPGANRDATVTVEDIPVHFVQTPDFIRGKTCFLLDKTIQAKHIRRINPDIVHAHGTEESNAMAAIKSGLPSLLTLQGCFFIINRMMPPKLGSRQWIVEKLERTTIPKFDHIITKSHYIENLIRDVFPEPKTHVIPNTFDPKLSGIPIPEKNSGSLAFVGTIDPRKGLHLLAEALEKHSGLKSQVSSLSIFGNAENTSDYEQSTINNLQSTMGAKLHLHGKIPSLELAEKLASIQILVAPSLEEMFGNQVIEAILMGAFPIVSSGTAMAENVERFGFGTIFENNNAEDLARTLEHTLSLKNQPSAFSFQDSRERLLDYMSPDSVATKHQQLYEKILETRLRIA